MPHDPQLVFQHVEARLSANPGIHLSRLASELACERHLIERSVKAVTSMPFREYRQVRLLATALQLLGKKPLLIKQISGAAGVCISKVTVAAPENEDGAESEQLSGSDDPDSRGEYQRWDVFFHFCEP